MNSSRRNAVKAEEIDFDYAAVDATRLNYLTAVGADHLAGYEGCGITAQKRNQLRDFLRCPHPAHWNFLDTLGELAHLTIRLDKGRVGYPRRNDVDPDPIFGVPPRDRLGKTNHPGLRCRICRRTRAASYPAQG